ncbi:Methionine aminopeptidase 1 [Agyrium rufum]|nr:Methionine aminopeptidase 1 [Agyrium rufum]
MQGDNNVAMEEKPKRQCSGVDCPNEAGTLQCPNCLKLSKESFFCSQDCFKRSWSVHKLLHKSNTSSTNGGTLSDSLRALFPPKVVSEPDPTTGLYNPFPTFAFTGTTRPVYPLSPRRAVPKSIKLPDYAVDGIPISERKFIRRNDITILNKTEQEAMRKVCRLAREVLDLAAAAIKPGITTDYLDELVHNACIERNSYPSPLNYVHFPKSLCTSPNEVICHGIPDQRILLDGDILNLDVTLYHGGFHGDINETYYVGEKAPLDASSVRVVETARECLDEGIKLVKPGMAFRDIGNAIEKHAKSKGCNVVKTYVGHGINQLFHTTPNIPHYAKNKAVGTAKPGMCFTIEPMISLGSYRDKTWPDDWTSATEDGSRTAQFEHTLMVTENGVEVLTARLAGSPGGPVPMPLRASNGAIASNGDVAEAKKG